MIIDQTLANHLLILTIFISRGAWYGLYLCGIDWAPRDRKCKRRYHQHSRW